MPFLILQITLAFLSQQIFYFMAVKHNPQQCITLFFQHATIIAHIRIMYSDAYVLVANNVTYSYFYYC